MSYSRLIFTIFSAVASILVFAISNNIYIYAQLSYSPTTSTTPASRLAQSPQQTNSPGSDNSSVSTTFVLRPLPDGTCPSGYHLVSGAVCIKDLPSAAPQTTPTNNATKSFSVPSPSISQPNDTNPTNNDNNTSANSNNEENFNTEILKSFNQDFK
jgi:hypothetical protein